jgi:hypothetical protein
MHDGKHLHGHVGNPIFAAALGAAVEADPCLSERTAGDEQGRRAIDIAHPVCMQAMRAALKAVETRLA